MTTKHTPGPWVIVPDRNFPGEENFIVLSPDRAPLVDSINRSPSADPSALEADMRLIAAAPDLLAAIQAINNAFNSLLAQCGSNPVFNSFGTEVNMHQLNIANEMATRARWKATGIAA